MEEGNNKKEGGFQSISIGAQQLDFLQSSEFLNVMGKFLNELKSGSKEDKKANKATIQKLEELASAIISVERSDKQSYRVLRELANEFSNAARKSESTSPELREFSKQIHSTIGAIYNSLDKVAKQSTDDTVSLVKSVYGGFENLKDSEQKFVKQLIRNIQGEKFGHGESIDANKIYGAIYSASNPEESKRLRRESNESASMMKKLLRSKIDPSIILDLLTSTDNKIGSLINQGSSKVPETDTVTKSIEDNTKKILDDSSKVPETDTVTKSIEDNTKKILDYIINPAGKVGGECVCQEEIKALMDAMISGFTKLYSRLYNYHKNITDAIKVLHPKQSDEKTKKDVPKNEGIWSLIGSEDAESDSKGVWSLLEKKIQLEDEQAYNNLAGFRSIEELLQREIKAQEELKNTPPPPIDMSFIRDHLKMVNSFVLGKGDVIGQQPPTTPPPPIDMSFFKDSMKMVDSFVGGRGKVIGQHLPTPPIDMSFFKDSMKMVDSFVLGKGKAIRQHLPSATPGGAGAGVAQPKGILGRIKESLVPMSTFIKGIPGDLKSLGQDIILYLKYRLGIITADQRKIMQIGQNIAYINNSSLTMKDSYYDKLRNSLSNYFKKDAPTVDKKGKPIKERKGVAKSYQGISETIKNIRSDPIEGFTKLNESFMEKLNINKDSKGGKMMSKMAGGIGMVVELVSKLVKSSPILGAVFDLFQLAFMLILMPFGNILGEWLLPMAIKLIDFAIWFNEAFGKARTWLREKFQGLLDWFGKAWEVIKSIPGKIVDGFWSVVEWLMELPGKIAEGFRSAIEWLKERVGESIEKVKVFFQNIYDTLWDFFEPVRNAVQAAVDWLKELPGKIVEGFKNIIETFREKIAESIEKWKEIFETIKGYLVDAYEYLKGIPGKIVDGFKNIYETAKTWLSDKVEKVKTFFEPLVTKMKEAVEWIKDLPTKITDGFRGIIDTLWNKITGLFGGVGDAVEGVKDSIGSAGGRVKDSVGGAWDSLKGVFGYAGGGYIPATPGGTLVKVGEGTRGEYIVPEGNNIPGTSSNSGINIYITFSGNVYGMNDFESKVTTIVNRVSNKSFYR